VITRAPAFESSMANERIEMNPEITGGKPGIRGTRIPVELVLRKLGAGMSIKAILVDHSRLTPEDIRAAQVFAADDLAQEDVIFGLSKNVRWLADACVA
jgi:uncharacterized protein (DUF433 family)